MSARGRMVHRAAVERNTASGTDDYGHPVAPVFEALATVPCFAWSTSRTEVVDGGKYAKVESLKMLLPLDADVTEADEIAGVTDRQGNTILDGRLKIEGLQRKHRHFEATLQRVQ